MKKEKKKSEEKIVKTRDSVPEGKPSIFWQAPEFEYIQKGASWYWLSLIIGIVVFALAIWQKNFLFAIFVVVAWLVIIYLTNRFPTVWKFEINERGIAISLPNDDSASVKFYPYGEIEGFNIHSIGDEYKELILKLKSRFSPYLKINFYVKDEEKIKNFLLKHISEEEYRESLADSFSKLIRF